MKFLTALSQTVVLLSISMAATLQTTPLRNRPIGVGDIAPDFTLEDRSGHKVTLSDARAKNPIVLVFYRGYW